MITKNSYKELGRILYETLDSTLQVPYRTLILVDDSDDSSTVNAVKKWCEEHNKELVVSRSRLYGYHRPTRATARQTAIDIFLENFKEEWLLFLDDDCVLNEGWWEEAKEHIPDPKVGLIWGLNYDSDPYRKIWLERVRIDYVKYLIEQFQARGGTHDTMLRRSAVEDIFIPPELHIFEDAYIKLFVEAKGYECRVLKTGVIHKRPDRSPSRRTLETMAKYAIMLGLEDKRYIHKWFSLFALGRTTFGSPLTILYSIKYSGGLQGLKIGIKRSVTKWLYRFYLLCYSFKCKYPENPHRLVLALSKKYKLSQLE